MLRALLKGQIDKMERTWGYDAAYLRHLLNASPPSFVRFGLVSQMVDRKAAPAEVYAYVIRWRDGLGALGIKSGDVTLLR